MKVNADITSISNLGFWLICDNKEYFVAFNDYPAFKKASINNIFNVKYIAHKQLNWPELDIDIEIDALEKPNLFPLVFKD